MKERKIYVVGHSVNYACWMQGIITNNFKDADLIVFTGGEDVCPSLYKRKCHPTTSYNIARDYEERNYFHMARKLNKPMVGICRGSQFLCAMSGGILVQHQQNPAFFHEMYTNDGKKLIISSTHHQAQYPFLLPNNEYKVLGWTENMLPFHYGTSWQEELDPPLECEIVHYPKTRCLGIQGHPEMMYSEDRPEYPGITYLEDQKVHSDFDITINYLQNLLTRFLENTLDR